MCTLYFRLSVTLATIFDVSSQCLFVNRLAFPFILLLRREICSVALFICIKYLMGIGRSMVFLTEPLSQSTLVVKWAHM